MRRHHIALFLGLWAPLAGCDNADFGSSGGLSGASKTKKGTATDGKTNGDDDDDSQKSKTETGTNTDILGKTATDTDANSTNTDGLTSVEQQIVDKTPGVAVAKVGVNFEDTHGGDADYNDAVLCFEGKFKVDATNVVSIADQTVTGTTWSHSGCHHTVRVEISHADGAKENPISYDSRSTAPVTMKFKVGSKLEVFMTPTDKCQPGLQRSMHTPSEAKVAPDVCNMTGG